MSNAKMCDICKKPIIIKQSFLFNHSLYEQYKVKIQRIEEGCSFAGSFSKKEYLDVCPICMKKFVEFANEERKGGTE